MKKANLLRKWTKYLNSVVKRKQWKVSFFRPERRLTGAQKFRANSKKSWRNLKRINLIVLPRSQSMMMMVGLLQELMQMTQYQFRILTKAFWIAFWKLKCMNKWRTLNHATVPYSDLYFKQRYFCKTIFTIKNSSIQ